MPEVRTSLDQKPYESIYLCVHTTIDHPVAKVWPHAVNIGSWMNAHRLESISGEPTRVGHFERVFPRGVGDEVPKPHYHLYGIAEVIPHKLIALEVLPENGGSYGITREWMSFDSIIFTDLGARTELTFLMIDVHMGRGEADFHERRKKELETSAGKLLTKYFETLKQLVREG